MYILILTLCLSNGNCYQSGPVAFDTLQECKHEMKVMRKTTQIGRNAMACVKG